MRQVSDPAKKGTEGLKANLSESRLSPAALGFGAIAAGALLFAMAAAVAKDLFAAGVKPLHLAEARALIALVGFALIPGSWARPAARFPPHKLIALGLSIALVTLTYYLAIDHLAVAVAIVLQYTAPVLVVLWAALIARRHPTKVMLLALVAAISGVVFVSELPWASAARLDLFGVAMGLLSALFFTTYTVLSEQMGTTHNSLAALLRGFFVACCFWLAFQLPQGLPRDVLDPEHLPGIAFVGVGGTLIAFLLFVWGVQRVRAERASIAATLEPVLAGVVAWVWLGERLSLSQITGGALVLGAVIALYVHTPSLERSS